MLKLTADEANRIVQEHLKGKQKRYFDEVGVRFSDDIWAFPNNRKIFIGMNDFPMDDKTLSLVNRAIFRHNLSQSMTKSQFVVVCGVVLFIATAFGVSMCDHPKKQKARVTTTLDKIDMQKLSKLAHFSVGRVK
ncbi:MAG: hypothetical protein J5742_03935 [Alphaproteobacteria bacterium]|nr:hypothetical protein [Alphaproteobacteria bacterium]